MAAYGHIRVHAAHDLNAVQFNEFERIVVEAVVCDELLEECNELWSAPFVWFGKVDVFEVKNEILAFFGLVDTAIYWADLLNG